MTLGAQWSVQHFWGNIDGNYGKWTQPERSVNHELHETKVESFWTTKQKIQFFKNKYMISFMVFYERW